MCHIFVGGHKINLSQGSFDLHTQHFQSVAFMNQYFLCIHNRPPPNMFPSGLEYEPALPSMLGLYNVIYNEGY